MSINDSKRLRRNYLSFTDFPDSILKSVTDYLHPVSQALFAVALTAPSRRPEPHYWKKPNSWLAPNILFQLTRPSKAIVSNGQWDILDFGSLDDTLIHSLWNHDMLALLACIDARHKLKILKLHENSNENGYGLRPLAGSTVLKQLDLHPDNESLSPETTLPTLVSIIDDRNNSLIHLTLPNSWAHREQDYSPLRQFVRRYNGMMEYKRFNCAECASRGLITRVGEEYVCFEGGTWLERTDRSTSRNWEGSYNPQAFTCYSCLMNYCEESDDRVIHCRECKRARCGKCSPPNDSCAMCGDPYEEEGGYCCSLCVSKNNFDTKKCERCDTTYCVRHNNIHSCCNCGLTLCEECGGYSICKYCSKVICQQCNDGESIMASCEWCLQDMCFRCIEKRGEDADYDCVDCQEVALSHLITIKEAG